MIASKDGSRRSQSRNALLAIWILPSLVTVASAQGPVESSAAEETGFPVAPVALVEGAFRRCEGIAFNGEGLLFVAGDRALWRVEPAGEVEKIAELHSNLGLAPLGERDILMADFGVTNRFDQGPNADGIVWRISPEGESERLVDGGIGDPNFVLVLPDGSFLVSDDATDEILRVDAGGDVELFTDAVGHPNGLALSLDARTLYVAQIFDSLRPLVFDDRVWSVPLEAGRVAGPPALLARTTAGAGNDGLAVDERGRIYVAANVTGQIWRIDPQSGEKVLIAEDMPGVASLAFGRGKFDHRALYATSTRTGKVWVVRVGVAGAPLFR